MSEEKFWNCTPRKLNALLKVHAIVNGGDDEDTKPTPKGQQKSKVQYIDQVLPFI